MTPMTRTFVEGRYVPAGPWAARKIARQVQHLVADYRAGERRDGEGRAIFDAQGDVAGQPAARAILTAAIGPKVAFHRLILSPGPRAGVVRPLDLRTWTRLLLMDLGHELGQQLVWGPPSTATPTSRTSMCCSPARPSGPTGRTRGRCGVWSCAASITSPMASYASAGTCARPRSARSTATGPPRDGPREWTDGRSTLMKSVERVRGEESGETCPWCDDAAERLVNPYATHARIGEAHQRLARVRDATTEIQMAVTAAHALLTFGAS